MRFATVAFGLVALSAQGLGLSVFNGLVPASVEDDGTEIPGDSPLRLCKGDRSNDTVTIEHVDLSPNPPIPGQELLIKASGVVHKTIEEGTVVKLVVKYGLIKLLSTTADFCEQIGNVDLSCPVEKGKLVVKKSVDIPKEVPPGTYTVTAEVVDKDDNEITCLTATTKINRPSSFFGADL